MNGPMTDGVVHVVKQHDHIWRTDLNDHGLPEIYCEYCGTYQETTPAAMTQRIVDWEVAHGWLSKGMKAFLAAQP